MSSKIYVRTCTNNLTDMKHCITFYSKTKRRRDIIMPNKFLITLLHTADKTLDSVFTVNFQTPLNLSESNIPNRRIQKSRNYNARSLAVLHFLVVDCSRETTVDLGDGKGHGVQWGTRYLMIAQFQLCNTGGKHGEPAGRTWRRPLIINLSRSSSAVQEYYYCGCQRPTTTTTTYCSIQGRTSTLATRSKVQYCTSTYIL